MRPAIGAAAAAAILSCAAVPSARAAPESSPQGAAATTPPQANDQHGHALQFGLRAAIVGGYQMVLRYNESPFCSEPDPKKLDKDQQKFCGAASPVALDLALSFALLDSVEPFVWSRFGLKSDDGSDTNPLRVIGAGARIYTMSESRFKIFVEPALGVELEGDMGSAAWQPKDPTLSREYKRDLLIHVAVGPQYDFARYFGIYANAGMTAGVLRTLHSTLELSAGLQLRAP